MNHEETDTGPIEFTFAESCESFCRRTGLQPSTWWLFCQERHDEIRHKFEPLVQRSGGWLVRPLPEQQHS